MILVAELDEIRGCKIQVYTTLYEDSKELSLDSIPLLKVIKPYDAKEIIQQAMEQGWQPVAQGPPIDFDLVDKTLIKRNR